MTNIKRHTKMTISTLVFMMAFSAFGVELGSENFADLKESVAYYKKRLAQAEKDFYDTYNRFTDNPAFEVNCLIKEADNDENAQNKQICEANYKKMLEQGKLTQINQAFPSLNITLLNTQAQKLRQFDRLKRLQSNHIKEQLARHKTLRMKYREFEAAKRDLWLAKNRI